MSLPGTWAMSLPPMLSSLLRWGFSSQAFAAVLPRCDLRRRPNKQIQLPKFMLKNEG